MDYQNQLAPLSKPPSSTGSSSSAAGATRTVAVLQPGYLPWLGFFDQMARADVFVLYDDVQFDKNGWRNRNRIKSPHGPHWLSVPVNVKLGESLFDVRIDNTKPWAKKHIATIEQFYRKAPFSPVYLPVVEGIISQPWERIVELDVALILQLKLWLGIESEVVRASELNVQGDRNERLINLCLHFGATRYLSGNAAQSYLDLPSFEQHGIEVSWQNYSHPVYEQQGDDFVPYLSVLDLLLNCGDGSRNIIASR